MKNETVELVPLHICCAPNLYAIDLNGIVLIDCGCIMPNVTAKH